MNERKGRVTVEVDSEIYREILQNVEHQVLPGGCSLFYEGQIPFLAFMLLDGTVKLRKRQKEHAVLVPGEIFGMVEHYHRKNSRYEAQVAPGAKLAIINRAAIQAILSQCDLKSSNFFQAILDKK